MSTATPSAPTLIIVSGLSGSGKSVALKTFEDQDYYCSDNLPINLLPDFVRSLLANHDGSAPRRLAVGIDVRGQADLSQLGDWRQLATDAGVEVKVLFFEASDEAVLKRYADTRRRHPLSQLGLSLPEAIARERELGTFDQLLVSPTSTPEIIVSKSLPALVIGTMLGLLMMAAAAGPFQIPFNGSFGLLFVSLVLFILSVVGIGLMISAISATQQQAILGAFAIGVPAVLMSGFATPVENMPTLLQWLAQAIPLTHFLIIVEGSFLKAMSPGDILASLWPLALIALVSLTMATIFVRGRLQ